MQEPEYKGIGRFANKDDDVIFAVYEWSWAQQLRKLLGLNQDKYFHSTMLWSGEDDIHHIA